MQKWTLYLLILKLVKHLLKHRLLLNLTDKELKKK